MAHENPRPSCSKDIDGQCYGLCNALKPRDERKTDEETEKKMTWCKRIVFKKLKVKEESKQDR